MANGDTRPLSELVTGLVADISGLFRKEIDLAKTEASAKFSNALSGMEMFAAGLVLAIGAVGVLLTALVNGLAAFLVAQGFTEANADALSSVGARVEQAVSAADALHRIEHNLPDVLLSDIGMPSQDGYALIRRVRALPLDRGGNLPAIALTAYARTEDVTKAQSAGFQLHVAKPVALEDLVVAIRSFASSTES